jgi:hypothetical protein
MKNLKSKISAIILMIATIGLMSSFTTNAVPPTKMLAEGVELLNSENGYKAAIKMDFEVQYEAAEGMEMNIEIRDGETWIGGKVMPIEKGSGKTTISVKYKVLPKPGDNYTVKIHIRPVGSTWKEAINPKQYTKLSFK